MKKSLVFLALFLGVYACSPAQNYSETDYDFEKEIVGSWEYGNAVLILKSSKSAVLILNNGESHKGVWEYNGLLGKWSHNTFCLNFPTGNICYSSIKEFKRNRITFHGPALPENFPKTIIRKNEIRLNDDQIAAATVLGLILGAALLEGSSDNSKHSSFQGTYSKDANTNRYLRNAHEQEGN